MRIVISLVLLLVLSACQNNKSSRVNYGDFIANQGWVKKDRVQHFRFQGWQPLDDRYLILRSNQRKSFLVKLISSCNDLPYANSIQVNQDTSRALSAKFDSIVVPGQFKQECTIDSIYEMDKVQKQALLDFSNQTEEIRG